MKELSKIETMLYLLGVIVLTPTPETPDTQEVAKLRAAWQSDDPVQRAEAVRLVRQTLTGIKNG